MIFAAKIHFFDDMFDHYDYDKAEIRRSIWLSTGKTVILYLLREQEAISISILWQKERNKTAMARKPSI